MGTAVPPKTIILGHSGFIGRSLFQYWSGRGQNVQGFSSAELDLCSDNAAEILASHLDRNTTLVFVSAKTRDRTDFEGSLNIQMAENVSKAATLIPPAHLIFLSSIDVYGHPSTVLNESSPILNSEAYATSKIVSESALAQLKSTPVTIFRLGGIYGPADTHESPIRIFIRNILIGQPITLYNEGEELRDYVFIEDLCRLFDETLSRRVAGVFNVATGRSVSMLSIVRLIEEITGRQASIIHEKRGEKAKNYRFDTTVFDKRFLNFKWTPLRKGIEKTAAMMKGSPV